MTDAEMAALSPAPQGRGMTDEEVAALSAPAGPPLPRQTGRRFIEPPEDDLGTASAKPYPKGPTADELRAQSISMGLGHRFLQPFKDIGNSALAANDFATRLLFHPVDTVGKNPGATFRETMRGVNSNIPFGNRLAAALPGGPPAESPEDAAAAPGARDFGGFAAAPGVGKMVGGVAARGLEAAVPLVKNAIGRVGAAAEDRVISHAASKIGERVNKRTRAGLKQDVVGDALRTTPELVKAAGNDAKLGEVTAAMRGRSSSELAPIYEGATPFDDVAGPIAAMDRRIAELNAGTSADAAIARQLETIRDEMNNRFGTRGTVGAADLRAEQTAYQSKGYGKSMPGDEAATARIAANREASKAVGESVIEHVTGMSYAEAKAAAAADPNSLAAQLFRANDTTNAALKIEAGIADREGLAKPAEGLAGWLIKTTKEIKHSPSGYALSKLPQAAAGAVNLADRGVASIAKTFGKAGAPIASDAAVELGGQAATAYDVASQRQPPPYLALPEAVRRALEARRRMEQRQ